jgi:predicted membrane protein
METDKRTDNDDNFVSSNNSGKILSGVIVVAVGCVLLANKMGAEIPRWVISWEMLLITIGFYVGAKHSFRSFGWMIPVLIGSVFLVDRIVPELYFRPYLWPVAIIAAGLFIIFNPKKIGGRRWRNRDWNKGMGYNQSSKRGEDREDYLDSVSIFGGVEKNIVTKDFKGGEVTTFFGGSSIDMSQADIKDKAVLELTQVFGGAQLIIPANWRLSSEVVSIFGGVEDKRVIRKEQEDTPVKTLVLKGTSIFGGIEIKSY